MKIGAVTLAYNDEGTIAGTIKCLQPFVDKHIVLISEKPYFGEESKPDRTEDICVELGVEVVKGNWKLDNYQRTLGNQLCSDCDWVICFDSDEMMTKKELETFIGFLRETKYDAISNRPTIYWKTTDYILAPKPEYSPIIACKPHVKFTHIRNIDTTFEEYYGDMHHLSWCAPKDIYKKVINYAHAIDFDGKEWYEKHYVSWKPKERVIFHDSEYQAIKKPLPEELKRYIS